MPCHSLPFTIYYLLPANFLSFSSFQSCLAPCCSLIFSKITSMSGSFRDHPVVMLEPTELFELASPLREWPLLPCWKEASHEKGSCSSPLENDCGTCCVVLKEEGRSMSCCVVLKEGPAGR